VFCISWKAVATTVLPLLATIAVVNAQEKPVPAAPGAKAAPAARIGGAPQGQKKSQEDLIKLRDEKFALEVFKKAPWTFDYDAARQEAKKSGKPIFTYFSRSYSH
jgi:hypothetical protein